MYNISFAELALKVFCEALRASFWLPVFSRLQACCQMFQDASNCQTLPDAFKGSQMLPDVARCSHMPPDRLGFPDASSRSPANAHTNASTSTRTSTITSSSTSASTSTHTNSNSISNINTNIIRSAYRPKQFSRILQFQNRAANLGNLAFPA